MLLCSLRKNIHQLLLDWHRSIQQDSGQRSLLICVLYSLPHWLCDLCEKVKSRIGNAIGYEDLLTSVKRCKLKVYGHVTQSSGLAKTILHGDEEADKGNNGKTTSKSGLALNGIYYYGKLRAARSGGSWL